MTTWLNSAGAAAHLGKNVHEVRRAAFDQSGGKRCPKGCIPGYKFGGQWRFDPVELDAHIRGVEPGPRPVLSPRSARRRRAS